ncbi:MAG: phosphonopyruvate decarboxylase [Deltaproteobacteria bacterium]|nr:phosphonopyruvate decarboxylase [Deltaproteobacteria bacterium]
MIDQKKFYECLQHAGVEFITGVPDSRLNEFCLYAEAVLPQGHHVIAANEGNAVALAAGYHLATGGVPLVYMQNSGLGNAMNPLLSLTNKDVYAIPVILLIGWRGEPGSSDWAQHKKQGELTPTLLKIMEIPFRIMANDGDDAYDSARWAVNTAQEISGPTALLAKKGVFEKDKKKEFNSEGCKYKMNRENAIECILKYVPKNTIFVATTGRATRELYKLRILSGAGHEMDFLNVGAMGHASSIAAGIALAEKKRLVVCLDGDAAAIMHLGALTTTGVLGLTNFLHVVLNNGAHESVGGQPTAGFKANLTAIAEKAGYKTVGAAVETEQTLRNTIKNLLKTKGPSFIDIRIRKGISGDLPPLKISHIDLKNTFMQKIKDITHA